MVREVVCAYHADLVDSVVVVTFFYVDGTLDESVLSFPRRYSRCERSPGVAGTSLLENFFCLSLGLLFVSLRYLGLQVFSVDHRSLRALLISGGVLL